MVGGVVWVWWVMIMVDGGVSCADQDFDLVMARGVRDEFEGIRPNGREFESLELVAYDGVDFQFFAWERHNREYASRFLEPCSEELPACVRESV